MNRRLSRAVVAALFALVLSLSTPSAFAAPRDGGWDPDFGSRIVRIVKKFFRHFGITTQDDVQWPGTGKP
jgi:hypothetical protein